MSAPAANVPGVVECSDQHARLTAVVVERTVQLVDHRLVERVALLGPVEADEDHASRRSTRR